MPPNATLEINLTMVGWKKISNVTTDGGVVKKVLKESESWQRPNEGATVTIRYTARLTDGTIFDEYTTNPLQFVIDGSQAPCEGLELALMQMKKGETALVSMEAKYAFGEAGATFPKAKVPPGASVEYEVEVVDFQKGKDTWEIIDVDEKIKEAATSKERGTVAFKANKLERCVDLWERAIQAVEQDDKFSHEQKKAAKEIRRACNLNLAAVHLKTRRSEEARKAADKVLETDSYNLKALYRRAQAYMQTEDWLEASQDIKKALSVEPDNVDFKLLARKLKAAEAEAARGTAQMWSSTFKKMGAAPAAEKKENSAPPAAEPMTEG